MSGQSPQPQGRRQSYIWIYGLFMVLALGSLGVGIFFFSRLENRLIATAGAGLSLAATEVAHTLDHMAFERASELRIIAQTFGREKLSTAAMTQTLVSAKEASSYAPWMGVTNRQGRLAAATDPALLGQDFSGRQWFQLAERDSQGRVTLVVDQQGEKGALSAGPFVAWSTPILNERGAVQGVLVARLEPSVLGRVLSEALQDVESQFPFLRNGGRALEYAVLTREGLTVLASDPQQQGAMNPQALATESARVGRKQGPGYVEETHWRRHVPVLTGYARTRGRAERAGLDWAVRVRADRSHVLAPSRDLAWKLGLGWALVGLSAVGVLLWARTRLQRDYAAAQQESLRAQKAEQELADREERTRLIVNTPLDAWITFDQGGQILDWNLQAERLFGWSRAEALQLQLWNTIIPAASRAPVEESLRRMLHLQEGPIVGQRLEVLVGRRDGGRFTAEVAVSPARIGNQYVFSAFLRDITEQKLRERRMDLQYTVSRELSEATTIQEASRRILQTLCEYLEWELGIFWRLDPQAQVLRLIEIWHARVVSPGAFAAASRDVSLSPGVELPGRAWMQGEPCWISDVAKETHVSRAKEAAKVGLRGAFAFPIRVGDKVHGVLEFFSHEIGEPDQALLQIVQDIGIKVGQFVERKEAEAALRGAEAQLRQSQKMEAIGRLAGGVAHDFNNLLTVINGYSQLLLAQMSEQDAMRTELEEIKKAGVRAAALTGQLLAFSRRQVTAPQVLDLNAVVNNMEVMLRRLLGEDIIELVTVQAPDLGMIKADPGQLDQVMMNLAVNARDAMPNGGRLAIETSNVKLTPEEARRAGPLESGSYILVTVSDTGCGMDDETLSQIFEPFFTTKEKGKGTGLGLSTVYGIVKQNGAHIMAESQLGKGTTFKIYFPRVDQVAAEEGKGPQAQDPQETGETILVVEDEPGVRGLVRDMLRHHGYNVLEARDGIHAQVVSKGHFGPIDLLLTDVVMPQKSGPEVAKELLVERPTMKVLYMSGYPDHAVFSQGPMDKGKLLLQKPFVPEALTRMVRGVLEMPPEEFKHIHPFN